MHNAAGTIRQGTSGTVGVAVGAVVAAGDGAGVPTSAAGDADDDASVARGDVSVTSAAGATWPHAEATTTSKMASAQRDHTHVMLGAPSLQSNNGTICGFASGTTDVFSAKTVQGPSP